jgi:hypothetical protein
MKKNILLFFGMLLYFMSAYGQAATDSITVNKVRGGYQFLQHGVPLNSTQFVMTLKDNDDAYKEYRKSRSSRTFSMLFSGTGGFLIGWPIGTAIGGGDPNWALAGIGAALVAIGLPLSFSSDNKLKSAVEIYNSSLRQTYFPDRRVEFEFGLQANGIGLLVRF